MIYIIGTGPGLEEYMSLRAIEAVKDSDIIIGYKTYIDQIKNLLKNKEIYSAGMKKEIDRCKKALECALQGKKVGLVSGGDAGVYGMAGIMHEIALEHSDEIQIEVIPGITAANAAAASLGAPIMHDYAVISLSDLLTEWSLIEKRLDCAGQGDFVVALYNPKSHGRKEHIEKARDILLQHKNKNTPVGIVRNAKREKEEVEITTLEKMCESEINMSTMVIIGNSNTYVANGKIITPRGYRY